MMFSKKNISLRELSRMVRHIRLNVYDVETTLPFIKEFLASPKISQVKIEKLCSCLKEDLRHYFWGRNQSLTYVPLEVQKRVTKKLVGFVAEKVAVSIDQVLGDIEANKGSNWIVELPVKYEQLIPIIDNKNERTLSVIEGTNGKKFLFIIKSISENEIEYDPYDFFLVSDARAIEELTYIEDDFADRYAQSNGENAFVIYDFTDVFGHSHPRGTSPEPSSNDVLIADGRPAFVLAYNGSSIEMSYSHGVDHELFSLIQDEYLVKVRLAKLGLIHSYYGIMNSYKGLVGNATEPLGNILSLQ